MTYGRDGVLELRRTGNGALRLAPIARAMALALAAGSTLAHAQQAFSPAWFAAKGAARSAATQNGRLPNGMPANAFSAPQQQNQAARQQLQRSLANLGLAARTIAAQQAAQAAARDAAKNRPGGVADGLGQGGLKVDDNSLTAGWLGAKAPTQTVSNGHTTVSVEQTESRAILNWETFNVGRNTTLEFHQQADWAVLNRVNDPLARPSQILGQIKADGTVMVVNRNGVIFDGTSQVDTRSLVAAAVGMSDAQFKKGLFSEAQGTQFIPTLANDLVTTATSFSHGAATGDVVVDAGARISTRAPASVTEGGGYVLLAGREVHNAGSIDTPSGQTVLAAGDSFVIRKGMGTSENQTSSTRGNVVSSLRNTGSQAGSVRNSGLITASTGDITLVGHAVRQDGALVATTSVHTRGTVHLSNAASDADGHVSLGEGSLTAIVLDESATTALDAQRDALIKESDKVGDGVAHRRDQSLVRITSGGDIDFEGDSLTLATGGQVLVDAVGRSTLAERAQIDVSGAVGVRVTMESNNVLINVQGNEQRDAPGNRDTKGLTNSDIWVDRRDLVLVPAGTNGYATDRWYTAGGLLEVSGYLGTSGHTIGEWAAQGGSVQFGGGNLSTHQGSTINLSGGTLDVQSGYVYQTFLKGADGNIYNASTAPGDLLYTGLYQGFETEHARWGSTTREAFYNPLIAPQRRLENGYVVGRDAGRLIVATQGALLEGQVDGSTFQGERQTRGRDAGLDGYEQAQTTVARGAQLIIGSYQPVYDKNTGNLRYGPGAEVMAVSIGDAATSAAPAGHIALNAAWLNAQKLGSLQVYAKGAITVDDAISVTPGGEIALHASDVTVNADLSARAGEIRLGDMVVQYTSSGDPWVDKPIGLNVAPGYERQVVVADTVTLDAHGMWTNQLLDGARIDGLPYLNGGEVSLRSSGSVSLGADSLIDVSSGAALDEKGKMSGGKGGSVTLAAGMYAGAGVLELNGVIRGHGVKGGGALNIENGTMVSIGGELPQAIEKLAAGEVSDLPLRLAADVTLQPGQVIPVSFSITVTRVAGGQAMPATLRPSVSEANPAVTQAPWLLPVSVQVAGNGPVMYAGTVLPAGTVLSTITELAAGYVVPADVFPNGLPIQERTTRYTAGSVTTTALVVPRGTRLPAGTAWSEDVPVQSFLALDGSLFESGFKRYSVVGRDGVTVVDGAQLAVSMPTLQADPQAMRTLASGDDMSKAFSVELPPLQQDQPAKGQTALRGGASLSLQAGTEVGSGDLIVGEGSRLAVDPGQSITLSGNGQITLLGQLEAHGGRIAVLPGQLGTGNETNRPAGMPNARSVWIGEHAVLDVSGRAYTGVDANGQRFGQVLDGGSIEIGANHDLTARNIGAIDAFVVVRDGARLDASGTSAEVDLPGQGASRLASHGGTIALSSTNGLFVDGELRAAAGGAGALGGTLALNLETPVYGSVDRITYKGDEVDDGVRVPRELVIEQIFGGSGLATDLRAGQGHATLAYGKARYGVDAIHAGGFDTASLYVNGLLSFDGDVSLRMNQALYLTASGIGLSTTAPRDAQVSLAAPYLRMAGSMRRQTDNTIMPNPVFGSGNTSSGHGKAGVPLVADKASFDVSADLVDIVGDVGMGTRGTIVLNAPNPLLVERDAFGAVRIASRGDLRLQSADFYSPGDTTLAAAQIYGSGDVTVGLRSYLSQSNTASIEFDPHRVLDIERTTTALPAMPYSVFGAMTLRAATVNQGGVLRAPLGSITLGDVANLGTTSLVNLLPGSVTSVSANGLVMPYGGTVDNLIYNYNGIDADYGGVGREPAVTLSGLAVNTQAGAIVDLSGGGELTGAGFLQGRGGSTDARLNPLVQMGQDGFTLPTLATNPVYAIVPGVQAGYAPVAAEKGAGDPAIGRQITIGDGVPGLPAGTYTLLPSHYALLPGAFRVELNGLATSQARIGDTTAMRNGSWSTAARLGIANTGFSETLPSQVILTAADTLRTYSQYNEASYAEFALQQAVREGAPRPQLERDGKALNLSLAAPAAGTATGAPALVFDATVLHTPGEGGHGTVTRLTGAVDYEILAAGAAPTAGFGGVSVRADALNATGASRMEIGSRLISTYQDLTGSLQRANIITIGSTRTANIVLRQGAQLEAAEVFLMTGRVAGGITLEQGASINTLGRGAAAYDASQGYIYTPGNLSVLAVSNGQIDLLAPTAADSEGQGAGAIQIGVCPAGGTCTGDTRLYSEGTIATATDNRFVLGDAVRYGTRNLALALGGVNVGGRQALADAATRGALPAGMTLNQEVLDRLLLGDVSTGAPALEALSLTVRESINFYDDVTLSTYDPVSGKSALQRLVLATPALYGYGDAGDVARIHTDTLVWTGALTPAGAVIAKGPGTGSGQLVVDAREIVFGFGPRSQPDTVHQHDRLALGFESLYLNASDRVTATNKGTLAVYAAQGTWDEASKSYPRTGGDLFIDTPLLTGVAGSVNKIVAGGDVHVSGAAAAGAPDNAALAGALGAEIALEARGGNLVVDTAVLLPSGKLSLTAQGDVVLADGAQLDLAGRKIDFFDVSKYSWGGDVVLQSRGGDVRQNAGVRIDLSAQNNRAGSLDATAAHGTVDLAGDIVGTASGHYDAGGTAVPFAAGSVKVHGQTIADFSGLNERLNTGGMRGARAFRLGQGDLAIDNELKAHEVTVALDDGHLTVSGSIDASGEQAGSIRLAASRGVTLAATSVLDASADVLRRDSYGQVIEAPNRAVIEVDAGQGTLRIAEGARMDLRVAGASADYGTVALNVPRVGGNDLAIEAPGTVTIDGAKSIQVNAFITDDRAAQGGETTADGKTYQSIDTAYLDRLHADSSTFIDAALANGVLMNGKLAGLRAYGDEFHLRPGVQIVADTRINPDGNLHVDGDIDLAGYRYASVNPHTQRSGVRGAGEAGALVIRADGDLAVFGSISDGFDGSTLTPTMDDRGWYLTAGRQFWGSDVIVPHGGKVTLAAGTGFQAGKVLNYDLPIQAMAMAAGTELPAEARLAQPLALAKGTVLSAAVYDAAGTLLFAAGTVLDDATTLPQNARLSAGMRLPAVARIDAMTWPAGVALPAPPIGLSVALARDLTLAKGAIVPSETNVKLPGGATTVDLRPQDADGNQGRTWALAPMLARGSQSWDITLVAGADTRAADRLTTRADGRGDLRFADAHYGRGAQMTPIPGTGTPAVLRYGDTLPQTLLDEMEMYRSWGYDVPDLVPGALVTASDVELMQMIGYISRSMEELNDMFGVPIVQTVTPATPPDMAFDALAAARQQLPSVVRTGTGDLRLVSGGDIVTTSLFGIYTAGTPSASLAADGAADPYNLPRGALAPYAKPNAPATVLGEMGTVFEHLVNGGSASLYQAWYPEAGGNLLLRAQGSVIGDSIGRPSPFLRADSMGYANGVVAPSASVGNWLWRQGTGSVQAGDDGVPTAWWINFGTYVPSYSENSYNYVFAAMPRLVGFTGFGTLGGGNLVLEAGADAGMLQGRGDFGAYFVMRSAGLNLAVASTGRVTRDGKLVLTGGGDMDIRIGGGLNADPSLNAFTGSNIEPTANTLPARNAHRLDLNGAFTNLRGALRLEAGAVGSVDLRYGTLDARDSRASDVFGAGSASAGGGPVLVLGDAAARLDARGDLVLGSVADPGRLLQLHGGTPFHADGTDYSGGGYSWFSLWTPSTAVDLLAAGGNLTPTLAMRDMAERVDAQATDNAYIYPSVLRAAAASGSIYYSGAGNSSKGVVLAPSPVADQFVVSGSGQLELLAADSLYAAGGSFSTSGADPTALPDPFKPGFIGLGEKVWYGRRFIHNVSADAVAPSALLGTGSSGINGTSGAYSLFSFTPPTASGYVYTGQAPSRYYAVDGDLVGLRLGSIIYRGVSTGQPGGERTWYDGGGAVAIRAGRDIVNAGTPLGSYDTPAFNSGDLGWTAVPSRADASAPARPTGIGMGSARGNLIVHTSADDVSVVQAGRDVRYSTFYIAGPGLLDISAGRDVYMADKAELRSLGAVAHIKPGDRSSGAGIAVAAGMGEHGADWAAFAARYLDPANQATLGVPLADQPGKVMRVYDGAITLGEWLAREFGYGGDETGAPAFLAGKQVELDRMREAALASGGKAANRDLATEFRLDSQLHLVNWLTTRFGGANGRGLHFDAATMDARAFFDALAPEQQSAFLRNVYYAELRASGREYNDAKGPRAGSYLRGREAIATLLPTEDADGHARTYEGDLTMFSSALYYDQYVNSTPTRRATPGLSYVREDEWVAMGSPGYNVPFYKVNDAGIHTDFGGDISLLVPGGRTVVGVDGGFMPSEGSGVLTQGVGDINIYSLGSLLLGQSRIFTTFGGNVLAWSAEGDINAGRGSKTTVVYTPARRVYDEIGNVVLSPTTPTTGAGIATLNPIPEVPPGDIDLIAPLGTIDAGEAGIRVSGNVNLAALHVLNAENIQVQGDAAGLPVVAAVNVAALSNASAAASTAAAAAQDMLQRERAATRQNLPSIFTVRVIGFGNEMVQDPPQSGAAAPQKGGDVRAAVPYDAQNFVQVVAHGDALDQTALAQLTEAERGAMRQRR
ncbi:MAG: filamentous hemagglutinin family protein [Rhodocyclaceae bacterium]